MKIGILIPEFPGQTHAFFWREIQELRRRGIEVDVVSTRAPPPGIVSHEWARQAIAETTYLVPPGWGGAMSIGAGLLHAFPGGWSRCARSIRDARVPPGQRKRQMALAVVGAGLAELARARGWDHLHAHSCADAANVALYASRLSGLPYSLTLHGPLGDYGANQEEKWRRATFALVITEKLIQEVRSALDGSLPPRMALAPMGVDLDRFQRGEAYVPWEGRGPLRLFSCGRLNPCKGHDDLVDVVGRIADRGIDVRLTIAGEDESGGSGYRKDLEALVQGRRLGDRVHLLGAVSEKRVIAEIEGAHLFCLASKAEPLGVAIMEAMALGVPVVVTGAGGVPELVDDGTDGVLVPAGEPMAMADAVVALAHDPERARRLGDAGRRKVVESFGSGRSAEVLVRMVAASPRPG
jgi:glycosyltransferase involved in cell wall biosynthesis